MKTSILPFFDPRNSFLKWKYWWEFHHKIWGWRFFLYLIFETIFWCIGRSC